VGLAALCVLVEITCFCVLHLGYPYNWPFTRLGEHMIDFDQFRGKFRAFHRVDFFSTEPMTIFAYPAPVAILYKLIYLETRHPFIVFLSIIVLGPSIGAALLWRAAIRLKYSPWTTLAFFASALAFSYPLLFEMKQGNVEIFIWALVAVGVVCALSGRGYSAATCFGVAGSMKIFPLVYLGLLIAKKQYRPVVVGLAVAALTTVGSLWLLCPDLSIGWHGIRTGMASFLDQITLRVVPREIGFDHSLFSIVKRVWQAIAGHPPARPVMTAYLALAAVSGALLFFLKIRRLPSVNQVMCLCIASILLPPVSYDYTLLHLYVPWALLVVLALRENRMGRRTPGLGIALLAMGILLAPLNEFIHWGVSIGGQIKTVVLIALWTIAMKYPFEMARGELPGTVEFEESELMAA
jgi:hypothetical protein